MSKYFLSQRLKDIRKEKILTQEVLAKELGVSISTIRNAELGKTDLPNSAFLELLTRYLMLDDCTVLSQIIYWPYFNDLMFLPSNYEDHVDEEHKLLNMLGRGLMWHTSTHILNSWQLIDSMVIYKKSNLITKQLEELPIIDENGDFYPNSHDFPTNLKESPVLCCFSALRKSHNPTNIVLLCVISYMPFGNKEYQLKDIPELARKIIDQYKKSLDISGSYRIKVKFIVAAPLHANVYDVMQQFDLTEKPNNQNFSFLFYKSLPEDFNPETEPSFAKYLNFGSLDFNTELFTKQ